MQSVCRPPLEHTLSWNPEDTEVCFRRTSEAQVKLGERTGGKAHTIDLSGSPTGSPTGSGKGPHFELDLPDVFEEDENAPKQDEESPLIDKKDETIDDLEKKNKVRFTDEADGKVNAREDGETRIKTERSESQTQHGGQLFRQDAMKEENYPPGDSVEIQMKEINEDKLRKQKSL